MYSLIINNDQLTCAILMKSSVSIVAHNSTLGRLQMLLAVHVRVAIALLGPLGHDIEVVLPIGVAGHSNIPLLGELVTVTSLLQSSTGGGGEVSMK